MHKYNHLLYFHKYVLVIVICSILYVYVFVFEIKHYKPCVYIYIYIYMHDSSPSTHIQHVNKNVSSFFFLIGKTLYENLDKYFVKISQTAFWTFIHKRYTSSFPFYSNFHKKSFHLLICSFRDFRLWGLGFLKYIFLIIRWFISYFNKIAYQTLQS